MMLRAAATLATAAAVSQQNDWLVHRQDSKTRLLKTASGLRLTNGLVERTFATQPDGYFCTTDLRRGDRSFFRALAPEANLTINGQRYNIGGCLGQPDNRYEFWYAERWPLSKDPAAFAYRNYTLSKPSKSFEWRARSGAPSIPWPPRGLRLTIEFAHAALPNLRVFVHYEMYDNIPAYRKLVSIRNDGSETVTVSSLIVELFRAQNWGPQRITALAEHWTNAPVPNDQQVPAVPDSLLRESPRFWYPDPSYDQCCADQCMNQCCDVSSMAWRCGHPTHRLTFAQATTPSSTSLTRPTRSSWPGTRRTCGMEAPRGRAGSWRPGRPRARRRCESCSTILMIMSARGFACARR